MIRSKRAEQPVSIMFQKTNPKGLRSVATARGSERVMRDGLLFSNWGCEMVGYAIRPRIEPTFLSWLSIPTLVTLAAGPCEIVSHSSNVS